jgi:hypothetical protein
VSYPWDNIKTLVPLILGLAGINLFIGCSPFVGMEGLIRDSIFHTGTSIVTYLCTAIHGTVLWSILYYMPLYYQVARNYGPIKSGAKENKDESGGASQAPEPDSM